MHRALFYHKSYFRHRSGIPGRVPSFCCFAELLKSVKKTSEERADSHHTGNCTNSLALSVGNDYSFLIKEKEDPTW
jgi:hypothetical protein